MEKIALILLFLITSPLFSMNLYFYNGSIDYGTEGQFNPGSVYINGGFDILRNGFVPRQIQKIRFRNGFDLLNESLSNPHQVIKDFNDSSTMNFFEYQVFPKTFKGKKGAWFPNYQSHLIGEGMVSRKLAEWYDFHHYPYPYTLGVLTTFAFQYTNEMMELSPFKKPSMDPIADIYLFNTAGYILFALDPVAEFFGKTLNLNCWYPQPVLSPIDGTLSNAGEEFIMKYRPPKCKRFQIFYSWGIDGTAGLTYNGANQSNYSVGFGQKAFRLKQSLVNYNIIYPELEPHFIFFYDKNESLLFSCSQTGIKKTNIIVNIYPGLLHKKMGLYSSYNDFSKFEFGVTWQNIPLGLQF